jgi:hypothetical protein
VHGVFAKGTAVATQTPGDTKDFPLDQGILWWCFQAKLASPHVHMHDLLGQQTAYPLPLAYVATKRNTHDAALNLFHGTDDLTSKTVPVIATSGKTLIDCKGVCSVLIVFDQAYDIVLRHSFTT